MLTTTLRPTVINVAKFSYQRDSEPGQANSNNPEALVKFSGQQVFVGRNSFSPRETTIHRQQYGDTVSYVLGRHSFKFGADALVDKILNFFPGNFSGAYTFNTLDDFGNSLLGQPVKTAGNSFLEAFPGTGTTGATTHPDKLQQAYFVQDDYRWLEDWEGAEAWHTHGCRKPDASGRRRTGGRWPAARRARSG